PYRHPRRLHSFPTRRSSDLPEEADSGHEADRRVQDVSYGFRGADDLKGVRRAAPSALVERASGRQLVREDEHERPEHDRRDGERDRKSTRLNSSHVSISYAV